MLVRTRVAGVMMMVSTWLTLCTGEPVSVTLTVTVALPAVVGVPPTTHPVSKSPAGNVPVIEQLYGEDPPLAVIVAL